MLAVSCVRLRRLLSPPFKHVLNFCSEITDAIKTLNNNESSGMDNIKNEQIKANCNLMIPIYTKLFNLIFEKSWSVGTIKPIYKNKGDPKLPEIIDK